MLRACQRGARDRDVGQWRPWNRWRALRWQQLLWWGRGRRGWVDHGHANVGEQTRPFSGVHQRRCHRRPCSGVNQRRIMLRHWTSAAPAPAVLVLVLAAMVFVLMPVRF